MKVKFQMLVALFIAAATFSACDDDKNEGITVSKALSEALVAKYPNAIGIEWERKSHYLVADCRVDGQEKDVWFNAEAVWLLTETDFAWGSLPTAVQNAFLKSKYAGWKREDVDMLEYPSKPVQYVIEVESGNTEYQLFYEEDGDLLKEYNVTRKDDTHWPMTNK